MYLDFDCRVGKFPRWGHWKGFRYANARQPRDHMYPINASTCLGTTPMLAVTKYRFCRKCGFKLTQFFCSLLCRFLLRLIERYFRIHGSGSESSMPRLTLISFIHPLTSLILPLASPVSLLTFLFLSFSFSLGPLPPKSSRLAATRLGGRKGRRNSAADQRGTRATDCTLFLLEPLLFDPDGLPARQAARKGPLSYAETPKVAMRDRVYAGVIPAASWPIE